MQYQHSPRIPFGAQSRGRREAAFISVKNNIRRHAGILGGLFSTEDYLHGKIGWVDCFFLGNKPPVFYNCVIGAWDRIFPDPSMTVAAIDRLVHHATIFER